MRTLLVGGAPVEGTAGLLGRIAPAHDYLIGADSGAAVLLEAGLTADLIVGDLDSLHAGTRMELERRGALVREYPADKDVSDLDLALAAARDAGATSLTLTAALAGRLDHTLATIGSLARAADLQPEIAEPALLGWILDSRHRRTLHLSGEGVTVSVFALLADAVVSAEGFKWPLHTHRLAPLQAFGLSNVITSPAAAAIEVHEGRVAVLSHALGPRGTAIAQPIPPESPGEL